MRASGSRRGWRRRSPRASCPKRACASIVSISARRSASRSSSASIGPDPNTVRDIAYKVRDVMRQNPNVVDPQLDWNEQSPYLKLVVDQDRARALGLTPQDVSQALAMLISGAQVTTIRDGIEKVGVVARAVPSERLDLGQRRRSHRDLAQRRRGAADADRQDRVRPRGADHLAAQPRHGDHGARRRRRRRAGARRHQPDLAEAAGDPRQPARRPTGSRRAARSRNPPRAMPRSSCCFR